MLRPWGPSASGSRVAGFAASIALVCCFVLPLSTAAAASCAQGRPALNCSERIALYNDSLDWAVGGFNDVELFEAPRPQHLTNPALARFWRFEAASAITRYEFELGIGSQGNDLNFEQISPAAQLPAPVIKASGVVKSSMARAMSRLMAAEQQEIVNLVAMDDALNRVTGATIRSRSDWAAYQTYLAAGFARRAASAISSEVSRQRAVTRALIRAHLLYGVGPADQRAAQKSVRKHGFPTAITKIMVTLGMNETTLALAKYTFTHAPGGSITYSMSQYLSAAKEINYEKQCAAALRGFANGVPAAPHPPD